MPYVQELHERYAGRGLAVLAISSEDPATLRRFAEENAFTFPIVHDPDGLVARAWRVRSLPTTLVVDEKRRIVHSGIPSSVEGYIERTVGPSAAEPEVDLDSLLAARHYLSAVDAWLEAPPAARAG